MKNLLLLAFLLCGCNETPCFIGKHIFVVDGIESWGEKSCMYSCGYAHFYAKKGLFQVGDTVTVTKLKD